MIAFRLAPGDSIWIARPLPRNVSNWGLFGHFASVQGLIPPEVRSAFIAFSILLMNVIGLGIGITLTGVSIDLMTAYGVDQPYSVTLLWFTVFSFLAMPCFLLRVCTTSETKRV